MKGKLPKRSAGLRERLLCLLFPARCLLCGKIVPQQELFCQSCAKDVPEEPYERRYSLPGAGAEGFRTAASMLYRGGFRKTLYRYKFRGQKALAKPLGRLMSQTVRKTGGGFDAAAWVPMTQQKKRKRGYDQSELLAKAVAEILGIPCLPLLEKVRETGTQHELSRQERIKNVKNAYRADREAAGRSVLLIDDIVTTGSTLSECAAELYKAGAKRVFGLCAADAQMVKTEEGARL